MPSEPIRIRCAADLFQVLSFGAFESKLAVLRDIVVDPLRATALGRHEDRDLVDLLLQLVPKSVGTLKQAQLLCLMCFDDPRVTEFLIAEFVSSRDSATILHLAKRLSLIEGPEFFRPYLFSESKAHALAAARHCSMGLELTPAEALRLALTLDEEFEPPKLSEDTLTVWLQELAGRHRVKARRLAERKGEAVLLFWSRYYELAPLEKEWLVDITSRLSPHLLEHRLPDLLQDPAVTPKIVERAIQLEVDLPLCLLLHEKAQVRAAAISAGLADEKLDEFLSPEASSLEAVAAAGRSEIDTLVTLLADKRWQVRAAASRALSESRPEDLPIERIREATTSDSFGERVAAVELLRNLGEADWLEKKFADTFQGD